MAISIPIISEFQGNGIEKARQEFKQLEGAGAKAGFALKKAMVPATAAVGALAAGLFSATKGAMEDAQAQQQLANAIRNNTTATDAQIAANEDWITTQGQLLGITDDELRPALAKLVTQTKNVTQAQDAARIAMDISAATGKSLDSVTTALAKAYGGNTAALAKLSPELRQMIKDGMSADEAIENLAQTFAGSATLAAESAQGQFKRLSIALNETKESVGAALLPAVEAVLPVLQKFGNWAQANPNAFLAIAGAITAVSIAIMAVNAAMALNPFTAIAAGIALLVVGVVAAYKRFETFREIVRTVVNGIASYFEFMINAWIKATNVIIRGINLIKPGKDIPTLGNVSIGRIDAPSALSGIADTRVDAAIGGVPSSMMRQPAGDTNVQINVNGGDPNAVVSALRTYMRQNGSVPIKVSNIF